VQTDEWWINVTLPMLESLRRRLRLLVPFIEKSRRVVVYSDFEDQIGVGTEIDLGVVATAGDFERFRRKVRAFLAAHKREIVINKIHHNWPITPDDIVELERVLIDSGVASSDDIRHAVEEAGSLGVFIRRLVGLDRAAAKEALGEFLDEKRYSANQIEFVSLIIDELTEHGVVEARRFYESPFTDISPHGPDALFEADDVDRLITAVDEVRRRVEAA
jgi:type I restriction enzyme R subunit